MPNVDDLSTPSFLIDLDVLERNCSRMLEKAKRSGVVLRPHVKTHKTVEAARLQLGAEDGPITVSTLAEAEVYAGAGFTDITYAVPIAPSKLGRVAELQSRVRSLHILVDHSETVRTIESFAASHDLQFRVFIKIDCGYHRAGAEPQSDRLLEIAKRINDSPRLTLTGMLTHAGHSYHATARSEIEAIARDESRALELASRNLRDAGIDPGVRSLGSTPTASVVDRFEGADEVRPGNYVFYDAFQAAIGTCSLDDCAATVLSTVLSVYPERGEILIDAGALALSKDLGATHLPDHPISFGVLVHGERIREDLRLNSLSQEHGKIVETVAGAAADVRVGDRVRIIMNHSCLTAALFDRYHVLRGRDVVAEWSPARGW